MDRERE